MAKRRSGNDKPALFTDGIANYLDTATWTVEAQPRTQFLVVEWPDTVVDGRFLFDLEGASENALLTSTGAYWMSAGTQVSTTYGNTNIGITTTPVTKQAGMLHVLMIVYNGASSKFYVDGVLKATVSAGTNGATAHRLGARKNISLFAAMYVYRDFAVKRLLTATEITYVTNSLLAAYKPGFIGFQGDSLTLCRLSTPAWDGSWPFIFSQASATPFWYRNIGFGGQQIGAGAGAGTGMTATAAAVLDTAYDATRPFNKALLFGGINDYAANRTGVQVDADSATWRSDRIAVGWEAWQCTTPAGQLTGPQEAQRVDGNTRLRANVPANRLIDLAADPAFGPGNLNNAIVPGIYDQTDHTHMLPAGNILLASYAAQMLP